MKKKIIYVFITTLLIVAIVIPVSGSINNNKISSNVSVLHDYSTKQTIDEEWSEMAKLTASDGEAYDRFGRAVSIGGDYAIIGAPYDDNYKGSAYVFKRTDKRWDEEAKLTASDGQSGDKFGISVSISGDNAIIGAPNDDDSGTGSAYVFKRTDKGWDEEAKLTASDGEADDSFGFSVSISGNYAVIGAYYDDSNKGSAYVFQSPKQPPNAPTITGETNGKKGTEYEYTFNAVDPNGDNVRYHISWDDGNSDTTDFNPSGTDVKVKHTWSDEGTYIIKATAEDEFGLVGPEGTLTVTMPRNRVFYNSFFLWLLDRFPYAFPILQYIFRWIHD